MRDYVGGERGRPQTPMPSLHVHGWEFTDARTTHAQGFIEVKSSLLVRLYLSRGWDRGTKREGCGSENTAVGYP